MQAIKLTGDRETLRNVANSAMLFKRNVDQEAAQRILYKCRSSTGEELTL